MSKISVTDFSKRTGSPFQKNEEAIDTNKSSVDIQIEKRNELLGKVNKKTAEIQLNKPKDGFFVEVVTHGAFTASKNITDNKPIKIDNKVNKTIPNGGKSLLGFPSSANDLALEAKSDLESDANISKEVKEKVIEKLFTLVSMVQHLYESKVRLMTDFDKYKEKSLKDELRQEKEHSEQLYRLNINFQTEFVQAIQQLKSDFDISRHGGGRNIEDKIVNDISDIGATALEVSLRSDNEITDIAITGD